MTAPEGDGANSSNSDYVRALKEELSRWSASAEASGAVSIGAGYGAHLSKMGTLMAVGVDAGSASATWNLKNSIKDAEISSTFIGSGPTAIQAVNNKSFQLAPIAGRVPTALTIENSITIKPGSPLQVTPANLGVSIGAIGISTSVQSEGHGPTLQKFLKVEIGHSFEAWQSRLGIRYSVGLSFTRPL